MAFTLHFLSNQSNFFATYAKKNLVIATRTPENSYELRKVLLKHHEKCGRWMNRYVNMSFENEYQAHLKVSTNEVTESPQAPQAPYLSIFPMKFDDAVRLSEKAFVFRHSDIFIVDEFSYDKPSDLLSMRGMCIQTDGLFENITCEDKYEYLESCLNKSI